MFFTMNDIDIIEKMEDFDIDGFGKALKFKWVEPNAEFIKNDARAKLIPDITQWSGNDLVFSNKTKLALSKLLDGSGEYLPLAGQGKDYCIFNPIQRMGSEIINLKETKNSYFDDGTWKAVEKLVFKKGAEKNVPPLFTIEMDSGTTLFCNQNFKDEVERPGLRGINFSLIEQA